MPRPGVVASGAEASSGERQGKARVGGGTTRTAGPSVHMHRRDGRLEMGRNRGGKSVINICVSAKVCKAAFRIPVPV